MFGFHNPDLDPDLDLDLDHDPDHDLDPDPDHDHDHDPDHDGVKSNPVLKIVAFIISARLAHLRF
jgi:ABC-type Zn2+ transport system substrate-binding protein/surface adhesin